jgi:hypothetical protein
VLRSAKDQQKITTNNSTTLRQKLRAFPQICASTYMVALACAYSSELILSVRPMTQLPSTKPFAAPNTSPLMGELPADFCLGLAAISPDDEIEKRKYQAESFFIYN